jgi:hypothetical protein
MVLIGFNAGHIPGIEANQPVLSVAIVHVDVVIEARDLASTHLSSLNVHNKIKNRLTLDKVMLSLVLPNLRPQVTNPNLEPEPRILNP